MRHSAMKPPNPLLTTVMSTTVLFICYIIEVWGTQGILANAKRNTQVTRVRLSVR